MMTHGVPIEPALLREAAYNRPPIVPKACEQGLGRIPGV
jgi:hypothetical protein